MARTIGNRIAPPRFLAYLLALVVIGTIVWVRKAPIDRFLIGFDVATALYLLSLVPMLREGDPKAIARHAAENDANRAMLLVIALVIGAVILGAIAFELIGRDDYSAALVISTLALAWLFANTVYAFHYAHLYYAPGSKAGGLSIPSTDTPDYLDFLHFALILGMTFQTADINITSRTIRRVSTGHCLAAFVFNIGVLAFSINMIAGS